MFFDNENEPDLGDELFGGGGGYYGISHGCAYSPTRREAIMVNIPISQLLMTDEQLVAAFKGLAAADKLAKETAQRNARIEVLEKELATLKKI